MAKAPAALMGYNNDITPGNPADLTLIDPESRFTIDPDTFLSKGRNTPFKGWEVTGEAVMTLVDGNIVYSRQ